MSARHNDEFEVGCHKRIAIWLLILAAILALCFCGCTSTSDYGTTPLPSRFEPVQMLPGKTSEESQISRIGLISPTPKDIARSSPARIGPIRIFPYPLPPLPPRATNITVRWEHPWESWIVYVVRRSDSIRVPKRQWPVVAITTNRFYIASIGPAAGFFTVTASNVDLGRESEFARATP